MQKLDNRLKLDNWIQRSKVLLTNLQIVGLADQQMMS